MKKIERIIKNQKGSVTIFVLSAMIFVLIVIFIAYQTIHNKNEAQIKTIDQIQQEYDVEENLESVYEGIAENVTYKLTINYVSAYGETVAPSYEGQYKVGESFKIKSPEVTGYTPEHPEVVISDMPARDVNVTVIYNSSTVGPSPGSALF